MAFGNLKLRDRANFIKYAKIELQIVKKEWKLLLPCIIMQYAHGVFHNIAYWIQGNKLSNAQRVTLHDVGFSLMPELTGTASHLSEYFVFGLIFAPAILLVLSIPVFRQNPKKPRYMAIILKRVLFHISVALGFRIISFLVTALPSPAAHCRLEFDDACLAQFPNDELRCVKPNPDFKPPGTTEIFTNMDAINGCGDLMFSSHTIYTLSFILTVTKYWWNKYLFTVMICVQIAIAFLIVASRKHYTLDVFSALYIVPLLWFTHEAYFHDINHKDVQINAKSIHEFYGIDISEDLDSTTPVAVQGLDEELGNPATPGTSSNAPFERKNSM